MAFPQEKIFWTVEEYLEFEKTSEVRHEYVEGVLYPVNFDFDGMAGESRRHNRIAFRLGTKLENHLENSECEVYFESVKMHVAATKYYYPDVVVVCDEQEDDYSVKNPLLIVEVLSPTTERVDRAEKLLAYQKMPSVQEHILVSSERVWIQVYRRAEGDNWSVEQFLDLNDEVVFSSINLTVKVADIYRNIVLPPGENAEL